jgi:hypothetical protein
LAACVLCFQLNSVSPGATLYVDGNSPNPTIPYGTWTTAARTIQDALDAAGTGDEVIVTNGIYGAGGRVVYSGTTNQVTVLLTNRVALTKPVTVRSVNGPLVTTIQGYQVPGSIFGDAAVRCAYLTNGASLSGFTLTNGATRSGAYQVFETSGGGAWCESTSAVLSNCLVSGNVVPWYGGGVYGGTLYNCLLAGNSATNSGGGACSNFLFNCTVALNSAMYGCGGVSGGVLSNCIVYFNAGYLEPNYSASFLNYSCTTPAPSAGGGNLTLDPLFVDATGGNFRLHASSPCIDAGNNAAAPVGPDLDGNTRVVRSAVDMGAYEYQGNGAAPIIIIQPSDQTTTAGSNATFVVTTTGTFPLHYQWSTNGAVLSGATNSALTLTNIQLGQSGTVYSVVVTNRLGSVTSHGATLTVTPAPIPGTRYVAANNPNPVAPYTNWATAAVTIQDAVEVAVAGDQIIVTNGVYAAGGRVVFGAITNRVAVYKPVLLRSVNGPLFTFIQGYQVPGTTNGDAAIRCAYLADGASLSGFTLTNGATRAAGDSFREQSGGGAWCESTNAMLSNCVFVANSATLVGGGSYHGTLIQCTLTGNVALDSGGGASEANLYNCTLASNWARFGGGADGGYNGSPYTINNCLVSGNVALIDGGGVSEATVNNCTITGNNGNGTWYGVLANSIVYFNTPANYSYGASFSYCCTTPGPGGLGNLTEDPQLASTSHLSAGSPCRNAGSSVYAFGTDIDGEAWANPPSIGCDEFNLGAVAGPLQVAIQSAYTNVAVGSPGNFSALIDGRTTASAWDFGDGTVISNQPYAGHPWTSLGDYAVVLRAFNEDNPGGVSATSIVHVLSNPVYYVAAGNPNPVAPYLSWATAAATIQDAVDAAAPGALVLVTNGEYAVGGLAVFPGMTNRVALYKPLTLKSVNGPAATIIRGHQSLNTGYGPDAIRCAYLTNGASIIGFTLTNGGTHNLGDYREQLAGGVWCERGTGTVANCVIVGNAASGYGGGAAGCLLNNCSLVGNSAGWGGGGASASLLNNCTVTANAAASGSSGGGIFYCDANNCILLNNIATSGSNYDGGSLSYCCTTPVPAGTGNFSADPLFIDAAAGSLRLEPGSPCIDVGNNAEAPSGPDLDGNPRIVNSVVDLGAYEFQGTGPAGAPVILFQPANQTVPVGHNADFIVRAGGNASMAYQWSFQGLSLGGATNSILTLPDVQLTQSGNYAVTITNLLGSITSSNATLTVIPVPTAGTHYVDVNSATPTPPFTDWATAAKTIQDAIDAAVPGDEIVVADGIYDTGGRAVSGLMTNRVAVDKPVFLHSVNGPGFTTIQGYQVPLTTNGVSAIRCVYLTNGATLAGFTLTGGATLNPQNSDRNQGSGGGVYCDALSPASSTPVVSNCVLVANAAHWFGGGASWGRLVNCKLTSNSCYAGGGAFESLLDNCLVVTNSAGQGGGAFGGVLNNCTVVGNSGTGAFGYYWDKSGELCTLNNCILFYNQPDNYNTFGPFYSMNNCCTTPDLGRGRDNITSEPVFVDLAGGDFRLQPNSPCINTGNNIYAPIGSDLAANPRVVGGAVDIGAYEFQGPSGMTFQVWLQYYGLPTDGSADYADSDGDGMNNWQEWVCGTDPTNPLSVLRLLPLLVTSSNVTVRWQSVPGVSYFLERSANIGLSNAFSLAATNILGQSSTNSSGVGTVTSFTDTAAAAPEMLYRVGINH